MVSGRWILVQSNDLQKVLEKCFESRWVAYYSARHEHETLAPAIE